MQVNRVNRDLIVTPELEHKYTLIWMHGLGDSAEGWVDLFSSKQPQGQHTKVVLLTAE